jgi:erythromycin esterase
MRSSRRLAGFVFLALALGACDGGVTNPGFGLITTSGVPHAWQGSAPPGYEVGLTPDRHGGQNALVIAGVGAGLSAYSFAVSQSIRADDFRTKRIRLSTWVKHDSIDGDAVLWLRVDGPTGVQATHDIGARPAASGAEWTELSLTLDVLPSAVAVTFGTILRGRGRLVVDDFKLETVGADRPVSTPARTWTSDSAAVAVEFSHAPAGALNMDLEGLAAPAPAVIDWLRSNSRRLGSPDPMRGLDDLAPIRDMIGSSHLVGLGEGTHGTREFFQMKHRIVRFLVEQMGFTVFAIEASSPESDDMNRYVLNGEGDPVTLLSHLYFWTWNTQEVLDMLRWMRAWNATAPENRRVRFAGFDMQSPGASMDSVSSFLRRVDSARSTFLFERYRCLGAYRNHGPVLGQSGPDFYATKDSATRAACSRGLREVYELIAQQAGYRAAEPDAYESVLHHARLVQQFESMLAQIAVYGHGKIRDEAMAENIGWIRDHVPAGAKVALWAHNDHVRAAPPRMGSFLRQRYADDYVSLGFLFGTGRFNALSSTNVFTAYRTDMVPQNSMEAFFLQTDFDVALLDARQIPRGAPAALRAAVPMREIGARYNPDWASQYFLNHLLPADFDLLVFVRTATETARLPFQF